MSDVSIRCYCDRHTYEEAYKIGFYCSLDKAAAHFQDIMDELDRKLKKYINASEKTPRNPKQSSKEKTSKHSRTKDDFNTNRKAKRSKKEELKDDSHSMLNTRENSECYDDDFDTLDENIFQENVSV